MSNIAMVHYKVGGTDGVSLEMDKWRLVLEEMGHRVHYCAGDLGSVEGTLIEEMYHHRDDAHRLYANTFLALRDYADEAAYRDELYGKADIIEAKFKAFIADKKIDFLIPENVWSVAVHPSAAIAITRAMRDLDLPALAHNHDFYWERRDGVALTCATAIEYAQKYLPPRSPLARHVTINSLGQQQLWERKGIEAAVVPNVFEFEAGPWQVDAYNADLRSRIGLRDNDVMVLQATRVVSRKGIELAVDFVKALDSPKRRAQLRASGLYNGQPFDDDSRIVLVLAGYTQDDTTGYTAALKEKIAESGIDALFIEDLVGGRRELRDGAKVYSLWDTYVHADFITYPSLWEGWGNQLLEALRAKVPIMLFEYPVYTADIKDKGFRVVSLGSEIERYDARGLAQVASSVIQTAADGAVELLTDAGLRQEVVDHNYALGQRFYSLTSLRGYLAPLVVT
ncbi:MAG: glycosyltransferase family 4 protein [Anaerolineae bacterium]|nr:glycosyltransferase family 4 protein [Anaerolineae bacterium]